MKTRNSLVSNSSSSSFIISYDPASRKKDIFDETIVLLITTGVIKSEEDVNKIEQFGTYSEEELMYLKNHLKDNPCRQLCYWYGSYNEQGRDKIIKNMFSECEILHYYCSDGDQLWKYKHGLIELN